MDGLIRAIKEICELYIKKESLSIDEMYYLYNLISRVSTQDIYNQHNYLSFVRLVWNQNYSGRDFDDDGYPESKGCPDFYAGDIHNSFSLLGYAMTR
jgi:hypothetical protein